MDTNGRPTTEHGFEIRHGIEMVPGTVQLVSPRRNAVDRDQETSRLDHHFRNISGILLIPQPSSNANDPLTWSRARKEYHFWLLIIWVFFVSASINWSGPVWVTLQNDLKTTLVDMNMSSALGYGSLALSCILLQPTAMKLGRRPIYIFGTLLNLVGCIVGGLQKTVGVYYAVNILFGFGASPADSLVQISTTDLFFAHERGTRLSLITFAVGTGSYLSPVAAGHISQSQGWRWCFWYLVILFGVLLVLQMFTLEESAFRRLSGTTETPPSTACTGNTVGTEKLRGSIRNARQTEPRIANRTSHSSIGHLTYWERMAPTHTRQGSKQSWLYLATFPFRLVTFPAIVWTGIMEGVLVMWLSLVSVTQSELFSVPPYNFGISAVGDTNISLFVGSLFGMLWGGPMSDWFVLHEAKRSNGISEPETRLWILLLPAVFTTAGLLAYGIGAFEAHHWFISAGLGNALIGFGVGSAGPIFLTYAIDCYPDLAMESIVLIIFIRNVIGFAFTFSIQPWINRQGGVGVTFILAGICFVSMMSFHLMIAKGKSFRRGTARRHLHYSGQRALSG